VISGGVRLTNWTNTGGNLWKTALPASTQYFENLFYNGERRLRPRLGGYLGTYFRVADSVYLNSPAPPAAAPEANCSVYTSGTGWECFDRFLYNPADPVTNAWKNLAPPTGNACGQPAGNSALTGDIELVIFEKFYVGRQRISCVDTTEHIIYLTGPTVVNAGIADAVGFIPQHRYVIENIEDQLTQPGQWFLDRSTTPWTLTYLAGTGENPNNDSVIMPQLQQILVASNLQDVTFRGLTIEYGNFTVPAVGFDSDVRARLPSPFRIRNTSPSIRARWRTRQRTGWSSFLYQYSIQSVVRLPQYECGYREQCYPEQRILRRGHFGNPYRNTGDQRRR
jgi:hypothetical protein